MDNEKGKRNIRKSIDKKFEQAMLSCGFTKKEIQDAMASDTSDINKVEILKRLTPATIGFDEKHRYFLAGCIFALGFTKEYRY